MPNNEVIILAKQNKKSIQEGQKYLLAITLPTKIERTKKYLSEFTMNSSPVNMWLSCSSTIPMSFKCLHMHRSVPVPAVGEILLL
jgi:hypothetical protein